MEKWVLQHYIFDEKSYVQYNLMIIVHTTIQILMVGYRKVPSWKTK